jgi:hypothetical protein
MGDCLMVKVKTVKIDGESIYFFNSTIYVFESSLGFSLGLDMIVTEIVLKKYKKVDNLIIEIELEDGRLLHSIMHVKALTGGLPQLNLFCELDDIQEYEDFERVNENDSWFPNIEEGITLEEIRKVEMPLEQVTLKLKLPIDQVEWIKSQKKSVLNEVIKEFIYTNWKK